MEKKDIRIPQQKRSIEKKEKIIEAATRIFSEKGYFCTNTVDIAKSANISTGSIYAYYKDKKDILIECLNRFGKNLTLEIYEKVGNLSVNEDIDITIKNTLGLLINYQNWSKLLRDEIMSLQYRDSDIKEYFQNIQKTMMAAVTKQLATNGYYFKHEREQTFLLFQMIMGIEDELAFTHSPSINPEILINECVQAIIPMLVKKNPIES